MDEQGPTWWQTAEVHQLNTGVSSDEANLPWFVLLEFFRRNAERFAILRAMASNGIVSKEATFSKDEISFQRSVRSSRDPSSEMRAAFDSKQAEKIIVEHASLPKCLTIVIRPGPLDPPIHLQLNADVTPEAAIDRFMLYLTNVQATIKAEEPEVDDMVKQRNELAAEVEKAAEDKIKDDERLLLTSKTLIEEKLLHRAKSHK